MESAEPHAFYTSDVATASKTGTSTKPKDTYSIRLSPETLADYATVEEHFRVKLSGAIAIAGAELARRIRAEQPAPKRKR